MLARTLNKIRTLRRWYAPASVADTVSRMENDWTANAYYAGAEEESAVATFWGPGTLFRTMFNRLNSERVVELACGRGRHSWQMRDWDNQKTLVDFVQNNIDLCRQRFARYGNVSFLVNNGCDLSGIQSESATSLFCYDAMVHFHHEIVRSYLTEIARILEPGGMALLHHSNYGRHPTRDYSQNPQWRAFMTQELFAKYAAEADLLIVEQHVFDWGPDKKLDAISLVSRKRDAGVH